jgi:hypothetical protein
MRRGVCSLQLLLGLPNSVILQYESRETQNVLPYQIRDLSNLDDQVHVFIQVSPRDRVIGAVFANSLVCSMLQKKLNIFICCFHIVSYLYLQQFRIYTYTDFFHKKSFKTTMGYPAKCLRVLRKTAKSSVKIVKVLFEIRNGYVKITSHKYSQFS